MRVASAALVLLWSGATLAAETKPAQRPKPALAHADPQFRRQVAGGPTAEDQSLGVESPELAQLRAAEKELFPPAAPLPGNAWPNDLPGWREPSQPEVHATGLAPPPSTAHTPAEGGRDVSWLAQLALPDLPVRWDPRVVRFLELFRDDTRARAALMVWRKRAGRYKDAIERVLRHKNLPTDLLWLAMIESGFDPQARSPAGAGLWQFMGETGRAYGLPQDRFVDERVDVTAATEAAADFLSDLHRRFGSWELAMASYNMGYAGVVAAERRYNTNDFWQLSKLEGSIPWETTLYVPKIIAAAIVMRNPKVFALDAITMDPPVDSEEVRAPFGVALASIAQAANVPVADLEALNPELRAKRTPPKESDVAQAILTREGASPDRGWPVRVPVGKSAAVLAAMTKLKHEELALERYTVRFGETLEQVAQAHGTTSGRLAELNAIAPGELVHGGALLLVPHAPPTAPAHVTTASAEADKPVVVVPTDTFVYPGRKRVFYKVVVGDTVKEIADAMHVTVDELRRWNGIDPDGRLVEGMTLQAFVAESADLSHITLLAEGNVKVVTVASEQFFATFEKNKRRFVVTARAGETVDGIGKRFGLTGAVMERINRRPRSDALRDGEAVVVYLPQTQPAPQPLAQATVVTNTLVKPLDPLPPPPRPDLLPRL